MSRQGSKRSKQIPMDLAPDAPFTYESFIEAPSNSGALVTLKAWPNWPAPALLLLGPAGCGKTHLGEAWLAQSHGVFLDDAHGRSEDDLFGFINRALRGEVPGVLLASRVAPSDWGVSLPDLLSRLSAMPVLQISEADDESLRPITRALFEQRGRVVTEGVIDTMLKFAPRDVPSLRALIAEIDAIASADKIDIGPRLVSRFLQDTPDLFD